MSLIASNTERWLGTLRRLPLLKRRKERATVGQYAPNVPGYTRATMAGTVGRDAERRS